MGRVFPSILDETRKPSHTIVIILRVTIPFWEGPGEFLAGALDAKVNDPLTLDHFRSRTRGEGAIVRD
jgi:hypothetical protein